MLFGLHLERAAAFGQRGNLGVGTLGGAFGIEIGHAGHAAIGAFSGGLPSLAVAVVIEHGALGGELAILLVMLFHRCAGDREHFEERGAAILVQVG